MANELGINMGEVYGAVDAVQTARLRNKIAEQEMALRQEDQGIRRNAIVEEQRRYDTGQAKDAAATTARGNMIRGAMDGSGGGFDAYVMIEPEQALKLKTYFDGLDEAKRTKALAEAKEQNATMGRIAAWVEGSADPAAAYAQARENLPPEVQAQMPPGYDKNRMQGFLAQAMEMDDLLTRLDKKEASAHGAKVDQFLGGGAPAAPAPAEREPANAGRFANGPSATRGAPEFFAQLEQRYRLPAGYLDRTWGVESGRGANMDNPNSSAAGHFQFIDSTAAQYGVNRGDLGSEAEGAARLASDNANVLRQALGREPTAGELYLAHQQGAGGAAALLSNPDAPASSVVGENAVRLNGGTPGMTAGEFAAKWTGKVDGSGGAPAAVGTPFSPQEAEAARLYANPATTDPQRDMLKMVMERMNPPQQDQPASVQEYLFAQEQGETKTYSQWLTDTKRAGASQVNIGAKQEMAAEQKLAAATVVSEDIQRIKEKVAAATLPTTGLGGSWLANVPGTASNDVRALLDTVKANISFDKLNAMRASSPTGAALGATSDFEIRLLGSVLGSLEQSQSQEQFLANLDRLAVTYDKIINDGIPDPGAPAQPAAPAAPAAPGGAAPDWMTNSDPRTWSPEQSAAFDAYFGQTMGGQ